MYLYMYVDIWYTCVDAYIYIYKHMHVCIMYICIVCHYMYEGTCVYVCMFLCSYMCIYVDMYTCLCVCIYRVSHKFPYQEIQC